MGRIYHLNLEKRQIKGAKIVLLPGDPFRCKSIAEKLDRNYGQITWKREYCTYLGEINGVKILVTSTGIGGPSTSIAIDELASLGIKTFIRVGTTGAIQKYINVGDIIITTGSVRLDGASTHYAPIEYPAVANYEVLRALQESAKQIKVMYHLGITASSDTFYPGQERYDSYSGYVINKFKGTLREWQKLKVLNYEMESSTVLTICSALGLRSGCVTGVVVNRTKSEHITLRDLELGETNAIRTAIEAVRILIK